jgi:hypothetical protein
MKKLLLWIVVIAVALTISFIAYKSYVPKAATADYRDVTYSIDGTSITLNDGISIIEAAPGSSTKVTTRYFGNDLNVDLDNDGRTDSVFLLTQETGGSGTFYYVVAALNTKDGYVGSDGYLLGDRIAPQTIEISPNPRHKNVIVANYADRVASEPMTVQPSVGKSAYLKLDTESMQWGIVEPNFEGEAR